MARAPTKLAQMAAALRDARTALRLTQSRMGELAGVSESTVMRWELGRGAIPVGRRLQLALGVRALDEAVGAALASAFEVTAAPATAAARAERVRLVDYAVLKAAEHAAIAPPAARALVAALLSELAADGISIAEASSAIERMEKKR